MLKQLGFLNKKLLIILWIFLLSIGFAGREFCLYLCCRTGLLCTRLWLPPVALCPMETAQGSPKQQGPSRAILCAVLFDILIWEARMFASFPRISACFTQWAILSCASFSAVTLKVLILWCPEAGLETAAGLFVNEMCSTVPQCLIAGEFLTHGSLTQLLIPWWKPGWFSCFHKPTLEEQKDETLHFFPTR